MSLKSHCPPLLKTRWLSRCTALDWLLEQEDLLFTKVDFDGSSRRLEVIVQESMTEGNFERLAVYHQLMYPLNEAVKFFERDDVRLTDVYPALARLKKYMRDTDLDTSPYEHAACP
jgi:hypothetical protein